MDVINFQECQYPSNYNKLRFLENHDQPRVCSFVKNQLAHNNYMAFLYFMKGTTLIYAGQEFCCTEIPSLFDKDVFPRTKGNISLWLAKLNRMKKEVLSCEDAMVATADDANDIAILERNDTRVRKLGIFSLKGKAADVKVTFADGSYLNHLDGTAVTVAKGILRCEGRPIVITCNV